MKYPPSVYSILAGFSLTLLGLADSTRAQSPIVEPVNKITGGPSILERRGEIVPLLWRARIGTAVTSIPLSAIEHYGIQDYNLDGSSLIRELTITMKSLSMVRIYHILPLGAIHKEAAQRLDKTRKDVEVAVQGLRSQDDNLPIKSYPTTTHEKMVEYRVSKAEDINVFHDSLDKAMVAYLGRDLVPAQRPQIVQTVTVTKEGMSQTTNKSEQAAPSDGDKPSD